MTVVERALGVGLGLLFVAPLVWAVLAALRGPSEPLPTGSHDLLMEPSPRSFAMALGLLGAGRHAVNSTLVALGTGIGLALLSCWTGFAVSQLGRAPRRVVIWLTLTALVTPPFLLWVPRLVLFPLLGLADSLAVLVLVAILAELPTAVLVFYAAFRRVSGELFDAARIDGCGVAAAWWQVGVPLVQHVAAAVAVLGGLAGWSDGVSPILYLTSGEHLTLPVWLQSLHQLPASRWSVLMAGCVVVTIPSVVALLVAQRWLTVGVDRAPAE